MPFPTSPTNGQTYTVNGIIYVYSSTKTAWQIQSSGSATVPTTVGGNLSVANTLTVTGNSTISNISASGTLSVTGNANVGNIGAARAVLSNIAATSTNISLLTGSRIVGVDTGSIIAPGTVLQVSHTRYDPNADTYTTVAQDVKANSDLVATFTPKFSNSKLYVSTRMHVRVINATGATFGISRDGADLDGMVTRSGKDFFYKGDSVNHHYTGHCEAYIDAANTNAQTFRIWAQGWSGGTWEISYGHGEHCVTIMEIAQ
jgi:hypothetical protein